MIRARELIRLWVVLVPRWSGTHPRDWVFAQMGADNEIAAFDSRDEARIAVLSGRVLYAGPYFGNGRYRIEGLWADAIGKGRTR